MSHHPHVRLSAYAKSQDVQLATVSQSIAMGPGMFLFMGEMLFLGIAKC